MRQLGQHRIWPVADWTTDLPIPITVLFSVDIISDVTTTINRGYVFVPAKCYFIARFQFRKFYASFCWCFDIPVSCAGRQSNFRLEFSRLADISSVFSSVSTQCLDSVIFLSINDPAWIFPLLTLYNRFWRRHHRLWWTLVPMCTARVSFRSRTLGHG
jgi:hypothetical protein